MMSALHDGDKNAQTWLDVAFFPLRAYHLRDCAPVYRKLTDDGFYPLIVDTDDYRKGNHEVRRAAPELGVELVTLDELNRVRRIIRTVVFFNDWDPLMRIISRSCHETDVNTIGLVEGVNDYHDADTGRRRHAYLRSRHVILPGEHDKKYFRDTGQTLHAGEIVRITELWRNHVTYNFAGAPRKALINSNFSYGVLEEHRDQWVSDAVQACIDAGVDPVISRHPFDKGTGFTEYQTNESFFDAIRKCDVSIHRFSSGILESLAIGVPVIYFNPHKEKIDKFKHEMNAYLTAQTRNELQAILKKRSYFWDKTSAYSFLHHHAGLDEKRGGAPGLLLSDILEKIIAASPPPLRSLTEALLKEECLASPKLLREQARTIGPIYEKTRESDTKSQNGIVVASKFASIATNKSGKNMISVIIPTYNVGSYVKECLNSLRLQTDENYEVLLIDDESTDSTMDVITPYTDLFPDVRIYRQRHQGLGAARNKGMELAKGEYITFIDSDDYITPDYLAQLRRRQREKNCDIVSGSFIRVINSGEVPAQDFLLHDFYSGPENNLFECVLGVYCSSIACARLYKKKYVIDSGIRFPSHLPHEDLFFTYKLLHDASHSFADYGVYFWRQRPDSLGKAFAAEHIDVWPALRKDTYDFLDEKVSAKAHYGLAARRNLVILNNFLQRARNSSDDVRMRFREMCRAHKGEIFDDIDRVSEFDIHDIEHVSAAIRKYIDEGVR